MHGPPAQLIDKPPLTSVHSALDFSSWQGLLSTLLGIAVFSLVAIGIRLLVMQTVQQRRERENRQINERLRTLIAAYKTLGGSFTGNLVVDPTHWRDLRMNVSGGAEVESAPTRKTESAEASHGPNPIANFDRRRRVRDAVEAALSDVVLLGTEEQVRLAVAAATDMVAGRPVETAALVVSLRTFIREVLDLDPMPKELNVPKQGPLRPGSGGRGAGEERGAGRGGGQSGRSGQGVLGGAGGLETPRAEPEGHAADAADSG